ncbi:MAG: hypothetical protein RIQ60_1345 [Pseudomonadota bacterium]|jgi:drug/metabolite transporter (DMT)-like permease
MSPTPNPSAQRAIACVLAATASFALLDALTQSISAVVSVVVILWTRYAFQVLATGVTLLPRQGRAVLQTRHLGLQLLRGVLLVATSGFAVLSLQHIPVGLFTAVVMLTPITLTVVLAVFFRERVSGWRWLLVLLGFVGALLVVRPGGGSGSNSNSYGWAAALPLLTLVANTGFQLATSRLARHDTVGTTYLYTGLVGLLLCSVALAVVGWPELPLATWALLAFLALLTSAGHLLLILAYGRAPASTVAPYLYAQVGFATLAGWLLLGQSLDGWALAGIAVICTAGVAGTQLKAPLPVAGRARAVG